MYALLKINKEMFRDAFGHLARPLIEQRHHCGLREALVVAFLSAPIARRGWFAPI